MLDQDRYRGCLLGLAVGDALGTTLEFKPPGSFTPLTDMVGGGPFGLAPGQWTDDTSMALCLAKSLLACNGFDAADQMRRYLRWRDQGYMSVTGRCFDIGNTVATALRRFELNGEPRAGSDQPRSAGNGSIMRLAPVPMYFAADPVRAVDLARESSRTTHAARTCLDACRYLAGILASALRGASKQALLSPAHAPMGVDWSADPLCPEIDAIARGSFLRKQPPAIRGTGYVVDALEAALWAFARTDDFASGALAAVNLGDDADTTGAIYGQIAGACYGIDGIPARWRERVAWSAAIDDLARRLFSAASARRAAPCSVP